MKGTIKAHRHFKFVMNNGTKTITKHYIMFSVPIENFINAHKGYMGNDYVYGIMVTKKLGNAVTRNYIKRRIRAEIQHKDFGKTAVVLIGRHL